MMELSDLTRTVRTKAIECGCGCWVWTGAIDASGYAGVKMHGKRVLVHRYVFELEHEPLGDLTVDHLCDRHRNCINPHHMEAVTRSLNSTRANERRWHGESERDRTECTIRPSNDDDNQQGEES